MLGVLHPSSGRLDVWHLFSSSLIHTALEILTTKLLLSVYTRISWSSKLAILLLWLFTESLAKPHLMILYGQLSSWCCPFMASRSTAHSDASISIETLPSPGVNVASGGVAGTPLPLPAPTAMPCSAFRSTAAIRAEIASLGSFPDTRRSPEALRAPPLGVELGEYQYGDSSGCQTRRLVAKRQFGEVERRRESSVRRRRSCHSQHPPWSIRTSIFAI